MRTTGHYGGVAEHARLTWTFDRKGVRRTEPALPGSRIWTQTTLLRDLLDWLDRGKTWSDIDPVVRTYVAADLRALADLIEPKTPQREGES